MPTLLDTSAWVELFLGTEKGITVKNVLAAERCYTAMSTLSEIVNWALKERLEHSLLIDIISKLSLVIALDKEVATLAGRLNFEIKRNNKKWGMLDSFVLATGMLYDLKVLAKDQDFKGLPNTEML